MRGRDCGERDVVRGDCGEVDEGKRLWGKGSGEVDEGTATRRSVDFHTGSSCGSDFANG